MEVRSEALVSALEATTQENINFAEALKAKSDSDLNWRTANHFVEYTGMFGTPKSIWRLLPS